MRRAAAVAPGAEPRAALVARRGPYTMRGCLLGVLALAAIGALLSGVGWLLDATFTAPFAHSLLGGPTLTGNWVADVTVNGAPAGTMRLTLARARTQGGGYLDSRANRPTSEQAPVLRGTADYCVPGRPADHYAAEATASAVTGNLFIMQLGDIVPAGGERPHAVFMPWLHGRWAWHSPTLTLAGRLYWYDPATQLREVDARPVRVALRKATDGEYAGACAADPPRSRPTPVAPANPTLEHT